MTTILFGYVIPEPVRLPQPYDTEATPADCEGCGEPMNWYDGYCGDRNCDCQNHSPRVHASTGLSSCEGE